MHEVLEECRSHFTEKPLVEAHASRLGGEGAKVGSRKWNGVRVLRTRIGYH